MAARCVVALGANVGQRLNALRSAAEHLAACEGMSVVNCSPVVATRSVGGPEDSPDYLNAVLELMVELTPLQTLAACQTVEQDHGRVRTVRWGPRTLDIDIIWFENVTLDCARLTIPHPRAGERAFVLVPWSLMDPSARLNGQPVADLARRAADLPGLEHTNYSMCGAQPDTARHPGSTVTGAGHPPRVTERNTERS